MFKDKLKASGLHFILSILVVSLIMSLVIYFWFPLKYISMTRFTTLLIVIVGVDLVMGPLLTFVIYNSKKKNLKFDLSVILILQIFALGYGIYSLYEEHPVYITFNQDRFTIINARDAKPEIAKYDSYKVSKLSSAKLAFAKMPSSNEKQQELYDDVLSGKADLDQRVDYYELYDNHTDEIISKSLGTDFIFSEEKSSRPELKSFLDKYPENYINFAYVPLQSSNKFSIIVLDKKTAQPITTIDIDPWTLSQK